MDIVADFDALAYRTTSALQASGDSIELEAGVSNAAGNDLPLLSVDVAVKQTARGRGDVVCVACSNGNVLVATSRGYLVRYAWDEYGNERVSEVEVTRQADTHIAAVFVDPTANHILVSTRGAGGTPELHYAHRRWSKSRPLAKLKGQAVTSVAWVRPSAEAEGDGEGMESTGSSRHGGSGPPSRAGADGAAAALSDTCSGPIVLGTESGALLEVVLEERAIAAKKEPSAKLLLQLPDPAQGGRQGAGQAAGAKPTVCSVRQETLPPGSLAAAAAAAAPGSANAPMGGGAGANGKGGSAGGVAPVASSAGAGGGAAGLLILVATPWHLYAFAGGPTLDTVFSRFAHTRPAPALEAVGFGAGPSAPTNSQLHLYYPSSAERAMAGYGVGAGCLREGWPSRFAWLVGGMVYHGELDPSGVAQGGGAACLRATSSLPLPGVQAGQGQDTSPGMSSASTASPAVGTGGARPGGPPSRPLSPAPGAAAGSVAAGSLTATPGTPHLAGAGEEDVPSLVMTAYHFIVLSGDLLYALNRVSGRVVAEVGFRSPITRNVSGEPSRSIDGLVKDDVGGTMYVYSDESLYEVAVLQEARDMWRVYLQQQQWELALRHCSSAAQRDEVHCAKAEAALAKGDACTAAVHFAKIVGGRPAFEDIALRLVETQQQQQQQQQQHRDRGAMPAPGGGAGAAGYGYGYGYGATAGATGGGGVAGLAAGERSAGGDGGVAGGGGEEAGEEELGDDALPLFLWTKLSVLGRSDRAQATMVSAWLTELYLDQINRELLESGGLPSPRYRAREARLRRFLTTAPSLEALDPGTTAALLAGYGRLEELVAFVAARGDHEAVLEYLTQHPASAAKALAVLRKPSCSAELVYRFAPGLVAAVTEQAVDFFITAKPPLDPARLIPAMLRFGEPGSPAAGRRHVLRYVEFAAVQLGCNDAGVHNLAVALHSLDEGEAALLAYLGRAKDLSGRPLYDLRLALRLAAERDKRRACVQLLCTLEMYEDAVQLALGLDLELAKAVAGMPPEDDEATRRRLWLAVAKHVVQRGAGAAGGAGAGAGLSSAEQQAANIKQAVEFLREADGLLKLEDILPFFPLFVTIDNFKDAICDSLERYNRNIEELRREMTEATRIADAVRRDLKLLSARTAALSSEQPCARCGRALGAAPAPCGLPTGGSIQPFFAFPTGQAYHGVCCCAEVIELVAPQQQARVRNLLTKLSKRRRPVANEEQLQALQRQLMDEVAGEDPRYGEVTVRMVDLPFVMESEQDQHAMWAI